MKRMPLWLIVLGWFLFSGSPAQGVDEIGLLDDPEQNAMAETFQYALEHNRTNEAAAWVNPDTDRSGTLVPVRTFHNKDGQPCREYVTTILVGGEPQQGYGTACRQNDGSWLIVSGESTAVPRTVVEKRHIIYPYGYRDWYDRYPYYAWDPFYPRILFSFDIVHFGHRHSRVHHFHGGKFFHGSHGTKVIIRPKHFHHDRFRGHGKFRDGRSIIVHDRHFRGDRRHGGGGERYLGGEFRSEGGRGHGGRGAGRGGGHGSP